MFDRINKNRELNENQYVEEHMIQDLDELVKELIEEYDEIFQIHLVHPCGLAELIIHTTEGNYREHYTPYIRINTESGEMVRPLKMTLTLNGPGHLETEAETTIYTRDSSLREDDRSPEEGLDILREELENDAQGDPSNGVIQ